VISLWEDGGYSEFGGRSNYIVFIGVTVALRGGWTYRELLISMTMSFFIYGSEASTFVD
tara:strand:+ start:4977 stop:5153 length:177 start_codon:yes stop_codon:yes gene_type:complete